MSKQTEPTKAQLIEQLSRKAQKASPAVRRHFMQGLKWQDKTELKRLLAKMHVTNEGDISLI
jgi:hypothetical protein